MLWYLTSIVPSSKPRFLVVSIVRCPRKTAFIWWLCLDFMDIFGIYFIFEIESFISGAGYNGKHLPLLQDFFWYHGVNELICYYDANDYIFPDFPYLL
jgi:hypothetical protein